MNQLLDAATQFPTVLFTIGLGVALLYWVFVLVGALDLDVLGGGDASGAAKGIGDALAGTKGIGDAVGGAKGIGDAVGGAKGVGDAIGAAKGAGDADSALDTAGDGFWHALGLATVPITISLSVVLLVGWTSSILAMTYAAPAIGDLGGWLPALLLFATLMFALVVGGRLVKPLAPLFAVREAKSNREYVGSVCTVTTGKVDEEFGQANLEDGGTVLVISVRCDRSGALSRGQRALIIDYDAQRHAYLVEPADPLLGEQGSSAQDSTGSSASSRK